MNHFRDDLVTLLNRHSIENGSNTPDWILADYLRESIRAFDRAVVGRDNWYGVNHAPAESVAMRKE